MGIPQYGQNGIFTKIFCCSLQDKAYTNNVDESDAAAAAAAAAVYLCMYVLLQ